MGTFRAVPIQEGGLQQVALVQVLRRGGREGRLWVCVVLGGCCWPGLGGAWRTALGVGCKSVDCAGPLEEEAESRFMMNAAFQASFHASLSHKEGQLGSERQDMALAQHQAGEFVPRVGGQRCQLPCWVGPGCHARSSGPISRWAQAGCALLICTQLGFGGTPSVPALPRSTRTCWLLPPDSSCPDGFTVGNTEAPKGAFLGVPSRQVGAYSISAISCPSRKFHGQRERGGEEGPGVLPCMYE